MQSDYDDNRRLMAEMWPRATLSDAMRMMFRDRLSRLKQDILADAIREARVNHPGSREPELKWILKHYHDFARNRVDAARPISQDEDTSVDDEREIAEFDRRVIHDLSLMSDDELRESIECMRNDPASRVMAAMAGRLTGPPETWTRTQRGLVFAWLSSCSTETRSLSHDRRSSDAASTCGSTPPTTTDATSGEPLLR